jgi:hypothetical protein
MYLNLNAAFSALADPTRRAILARRAQGEATVMELAELPIGRCLLLFQDRSRLLVALA